MRRPGQYRRILSMAAMLGLALLPPAPAMAQGAATPAAAALETWTATGSLARARAFAPVVLLGDGTVITAGGRDEYESFSSAERWTPGTGAWTSAGSIGAAAAGQVAAPLPGGKALFAGGTDGLGYYGYGDIFDPVAGTWTQTPAMANAHAYGASASLTGGDVMVVGGFDGGASLTSAKVDLYDVSEGTWSAGPSLPGDQGRFGLTATTLADDRVMVAGGDDGSLSSGATLAAAAIYTPATGWAAAESMQLARFDHAAVLLADGRVLVAGGSNFLGSALSEAEVYDPATGHWTVTGSMLNARYGFTLTRLADGRVLATGGYSSSSPTLANAEIYDPSTGGWSPTRSMATARRNASATALADGTVLVVGGNEAEDTVFLASAEIYTPPAARAVYPATTFHPLAPARILDTRIGINLSGYFLHGQPRSFQVTGSGGVPSGAVAVTGNLTVTVQSIAGYVTLGPTVSAMPASSTINFPSKGDRANNVTVALNGTGQLSAVFVANGATSGATHLVFDVTGYFTADDTGATYVPVDPGRILDTRNGTGLSGKFVNKTSRTFNVAGQAGVPVGAVAVTGNLTVVRPSGPGYAHVAPSPVNPAAICCSTLNAPTGDTRANGVTVKLSGTGTLSAIWVGPDGSSTDLLFDVTGYFVTGLAGARFVPVDPARVVDTRYHLPLQGPLKSAIPATIPIVGRAGVPAEAVAITGNLTVTQQTVSGYATVAPTISGTATTSSLNFPKGDNRANGFAVRLSGTGSIDLLYYASLASATTHLVVDLTGYYVPASTD